MKECRNPPLPWHWFFQPPAWRAAYAPEGGRSEGFKLLMPVGAANDFGNEPVIIIDELQAVNHIYMNGQRELITELFNFFVAMTKESNLAHVIISSSDGYFIDTIYKDSRLKKTSIFFKVDYLSKEDVYEWLRNLEEYSKIRDVYREHHNREGYYA